MRPRRALAPGVLLCAFAGSALGHDMWLVPPAGAEVGREVDVLVSVGMDFPKSVSAIDPARLSTSVRGPGGEAAELALERDEAREVTTASFAPTAPGAWLVSAVTRPNRLALEAAKFNDYLLHDGMPHVLAERMDRGELERDAVERYSKYVKALVSVGGSVSGDAFDEVLGLTLEIVPLADPLAAEVGDTLPVRVLFRGAPLERANLCWDHPGNGEDFAGQTWTDAEGRAVVPIAASGPMTLRLVHMTRPRAEDHEWESFWGSYTFRVR